MEVNALECPKCGAPIDLNDNVQFCAHCGARLIVDTGERKVHLYHHIVDESKNAEIDLMKRRQQFEEDKYYEEQEAIESDKKRYKGWKLIQRLYLIALFVMGVLTLDTHSPMYDPAIIVWFFGSILLSIFRPQTDRWTPRSLYFRVNRIVCFLLLAVVGFVVWCLGALISTAITQH